VRGIAITWLDYISFKKYHSDSMLLKKILLAKKNNPEHAGFQFPAKELNFPWSNRFVGLVKQ
jgi:hypothetical protein